MPFEKGHQFAKGGARIGAGRKPEEWKRMFNRALTRATNEEDLRKVLDSLRNRAQAGDSKCAALYLGYVVGKPVERSESVVDNTGKVIVEHRDGDEESVLAAADAIRCRRELLPSLS